MDVQGPEAPGSISNVRPGPKQKKMNCRIFYLQKTPAEPRNSIASHASHWHLGTCAIKYKTCTQIRNSLLLNTPPVRALVPGRPDLNVIRAVQITGAPAPRGTKSSLAYSSPKVLALLAFFYRLDLQASMS